MERSRIWILALLALLSVVTIFAKPGHAQDAKVVIAHKKALSEMGEGNRLDPLDNVLRVNKLREAALLELEARARFSTAWEGARIPCPTCKPGRLLKQICLACAGAGEVACTRCVGDAALQLSQTRNAAEGREHLGVFYWWRWLTTYAKVERDKDGFAIGGGTLPCPRFGFPGHKDERCKECKGKDVIKCDDCKGKGAQKCVACKGKGAVERTCGDCGGAGELPDPAGYSSAELATCLWCAGSEVRACRDCLGADAKDERTAYDLAKRALAQWLSSDENKAAKDDRWKLPGGVMGDCPTCAKQGKVDCDGCRGSGFSLCTDCKGAGTINTPTGVISCPYCSSKGTVDCETCAKKGEIVCPACAGQKSRLIGCRTCNGLVWRACEGCFRSGARQWELNAEHLETSGALDLAAACQAVAVERLKERATLRQLYLAVVGLDWLTAKPLTAEELTQAAADAQQAAQTKLGGLQRALEKQAK